MYKPLTDAKVYGGPGSGPREGEPHPHVGGGKGEAKVGPAQSPKEAIASAKVGDVFATRETEGAGSKIPNQAVIGGERIVVVTGFHEDKTFGGKIMTVRDTSGAKHESEIRNGSPNLTLMKVEGHTNAHLEPHTPEKDALRKAAFGHD